MRWLAALLIWGVIGTHSARVDAQPFEPLDEEYRHNAAALKLAEAGDFTGAIAEQQQAVSVRGLNVFWLNLGRFQQRAGLCGDAVESYTKAITAPPVVDPPAEDVRETAQKYIAELAEQCPARVKVSCIPADMDVTGVLDGQPPVVVPCGVETSLVGGTWHFVGRYGSQSSEATVELRMARVTDVALAVEIPVAADAAAQTPVAPPTSRDLVIRETPPRANHTSSLVFIGSGVAMLFAGVALDVLPSSASNGAYDALDFVPVGLYLGAITLTIIGIATW